MALQFQRGQIAPLLRKPMGGMIGATQPGFEIGGQQMDLQQPMPAPQAAPKKPGFDWNLVAGSIGDALQTFGGGQGTYAPAMLDLQEQMARQQAVREQIEAQARQREQDRLHSREDYLWKQQNPGPSGMERNFQAYQNMDPEQRKQFAAYQALVNPKIVSGFDGQYQVTQADDAPETYTDEDTGKTYQLTGSNRNDPSAWKEIGGGNAPGNFR